MSNQYLCGLLNAAVRLRNSRDGNPRWRLTINGNRYITKLNSAVAFKISPPSHIGEAVIIQLDSSNRIIDFEMLENRPKQGELVTNPDKLGLLSQGSIVVVRSTGVTWTKQDPLYWVANSAIYAALTTEQLLYEYGVVQVTWIGSGL